MSSERVEKYRDWSNYEIAVKVAEDRIYVAVYFRKSVKLRKPGTLMTVDVNLDNVTLAVFAPSRSIIGLKRLKPPLRSGKILTHRI